MRREKYGNMTDEDLIALFRDGDQEAMEHLLDKYKEMVLKKARSMYILGGDSDDLIQEGMLGLFKAAARSPSSALQDSSTLRSKLPREKNTCR